MYHTKFKKNRRNIYVESMTQLMSYANGVIQT